MNNTSLIDRLKQHLPSLVDTAPDLKKKTNNELTGPCPKCGGNDRFSVFIDKDRFLCRKCDSEDGKGWHGDKIDYHKWMEDMDVVELGRKHGLIEEHKPVKKNGLYAWNKAFLNHTKLDRYFKSRGLKHEDSPAIRYSSFKDKNGETLRSVLCAATKPDDKAPEAFHRTWLTEDGKKKSTSLKGKCKGRGIWLYPDRRNEQDLIVGEGLETTISATQVTGINGVAVMTAALMGSVQFPKTTENIFILVDEDEEASDYAGQRAALGLAKRFESEGGVAFLVEPSDSCFSCQAKKKDFNDLQPEVIRERFKVVKRLTDIKWVPPKPESNSNANLGTTESPVTSVTGVTGVTAPKDGGSRVTETKTKTVTSVTPTKDERPCYRVYDKFSKDQNGVILRPGVWYFSTAPGAKEDNPQQHWICSPIHVKAITHDEQGENFGRLLVFINSLGDRREWAMPMEMLRGAGDDMRGRLLSMGAEINPKKRNDLTNYLQWGRPKKTVKCALQVGWFNDSYVLPDRVIGDNAADVIFQSEDRVNEAHTTGGTRDDWQKNVAAKAINNPLLTLGIAGSFAGPLINLTNSESGGIHLVGESSKGKTTILDAACSTWGNVEKFQKNWKATANGMEGAAALHNDCLLALDEIKQSNPKEVGDIIYQLGNGQGKQRATRKGRARSITRWRCFVLSSGEKTITTMMEEGGQLVNAGQLVRLLDITTDGREYGVFDDIHDQPDGSAFSDNLKQAAKENYGHAGRAFLEKLTRDTSNFREMLKEIKSLPGFSPENGEGQENRAASRLALVALAGELATEYGITGWPKGAALEAAELAFKEWRALRGEGNQERRQVLEKVQSFIDAHGDSRFSHTNAEARINNRAGWFKDEDEQRVYLFTTGGIKEATKGFELKRALTILQESGALLASQGARSQTCRIKGQNSRRLYKVKALGGSQSVA